MRVAVYCRVSTDKEDQTNSFESQKRYFSEVISRREDMSLCGIYADEGVSGTTTAGRREFNRMIADARAGKFDCIITKEVSRFARNTVDTLEYTRELRGLGIGVEFVSDGINTLEPDAELRLSIMSSIAQEESRKTSARVKWGQTRRMEQGVVFGRSLLGYDVKKGKMTVNDEGAELVRRIYDLYLHGQRGTGEIAAMLSAEGILTARGNAEWNAGTILKILKNEKYCGDLLQKKTVTPDYLTHKKRYNCGAEEQIYLKDHHEPIIEREMWEAVQREIRRRARRTTESRSGVGAGTAYPLSGKIRCGVCGKCFVARRRRNRSGESYLVWRCSTAVKGRKNGASGCEIGYQVRNCIVEDMIFQALDSMKTDRGKADGEQQEIIGALEKTAGDAGGKNREGLRRQLKALERKKRQAVEAWLDGKITSEDMQLFREKCERCERKLLRPEIMRGMDTDGGRNVVRGMSEAGLCGETERKKIIAGMVEEIVVRPGGQIDLSLKGWSAVRRFPYHSENTSK